MGKRFLRDALPPHLTEREMARTVGGNGEKWDGDKHKVVNCVGIDPDTEVRLVRAHCLRLVSEEGGTVRIYHLMDNTRWVVNRSSLADSIQRTKEIIHIWKMCMNN